MKLYGHPISGNAHRAEALLGILGQDFENIVVNLPAGEHKHPEFLAMNPLGQVPVLVDGDVVLRDSSAILIYLARKYDATNQWLPTDALAQAKVQEWLSVAVNEIARGPFTVRAIKVIGMKADLAEAQSRTDALFSQLFEPHLAAQDWLVGDQPTIADLACYGYIARVTDGDYSLDAYPAINAWLARVEAIDGFTPLGKAADVFAALKSA